MIEGIDASNLTAGGLVGLAVFAIFFGLLVPRYVYKEKAKEADKWHSAFEAEHAARLLSDKQTGELLELAKTTHNLILAWTGTIDKLSQPGGADVVSTSK